MWHDIEKGSVNRVLSSYKNGRTFVLKNKILNQRKRSFNEVDEM